MHRIITSGLLEFLYAIYLASGLIKGCMVAYSLYSPVDITLFTALLLMFFIIIILYKNYEIYTKFIFAIIFLLIFYTWMTFSSVYTSSLNFWMQKVIYFLTNIIAFVFPLLVYKYFNIQQFFKYFITLTTLLNMFFIIFIFPYVYIVDTFYQVTAQYLFVAVLSGVNILLLIILKIKFKFSYLIPVLLLINFFTLISSGGRAGIIFTLLTLMFYFLSRILNFKIIKISKVNIVKYFTIFIVLSAIGFTYFSMNNSNLNVVLERSLARISLLSNTASDQNMDESVKERLNLINFSINKSFEDIPHFLFGYGVGSFSIEYTDVDERGHPHNIILEILFDLGIIGLFLFLLFYIFIIKDYRYTLLSWLVLYMTLNALKSSGLIDLRLFFAFLSLMLMSTIKETEKR